MTNEAQNSKSFKYLNFEFELNFEFCHLNL